MTLSAWLANRWVERVEPGREDVAALLEIVERDIAASAIADLPADWQVAVAYNAVLQLAAAALLAAGYRVRRAAGHHERLIESLRFTLGVESADLIVLHAFRKKRNIADYEHTGAASEAEARALRDRAIVLNARVRAWLAEHHADLAPE